MRVKGEGERPRSRWPSATALLMRSGFSSMQGAIVNGARGWKGREEEQSLALLRGNFEPQRPSTVIGAAPLLRVVSTGVVGG